MLLTVILNLWIRTHSAFSLRPHHWDIVDRRHGTNESPAYGAVVVLLAPPVRRTKTLLTISLRQRCCVQLLMTIESPLKREGGPGLSYVCTSAPWYPLIPLPSALERLLSWAALYDPSASYHRARVCR